MMEKTSFLKNEFAYCEFIMCSHVFYKNNLKKFILYHLFVFDSTAGCILW